MTVLSKEIHIFQSSDICDQIPYSGKSFQRKIFSYFVTNLRRQNFTDAIFSLEIFVDEI